MITTADWCDGFLAGSLFAVVWLCACYVVYRAALKEKQRIS